MVICSRFRLGTLHGVPGSSTIDEEVDDNTPIAVFTAPRFCLVTHTNIRRRGYEYYGRCGYGTQSSSWSTTNTRPWGYRRCVHGHGTTPSLWFTTNFFCGIQRIHDNEDRMIIRGSLCERHQSSTAPLCLN